MPTLTPWSCFRTVKSLILVFLESLFTEVARQAALGSTSFICFCSWSRTALAGSESSYASLLRTLIIVFSLVQGSCLVSMLVINCIDLNMAGYSVGWLTASKHQYYIFVSKLKKILYRKHAHFISYFSVQLPILLGAEELFKINETKDIIQFNYEEEINKSSC